jgi:hypothetical protein
MDGSMHSLRGKRMDYPVDRFRILVSHANPDSIDEVVDNAGYHHLD